MDNENSGPLKFYRAARFPRKSEMKDFADLLQKELGWVCSSSWVNDSEDGLFRRDIAILDLEDVKKSDTLILFSYPRGTKKPGGGRFVELGYALALNKPCAVIGHYENIFCHHPLVSIYPTKEDFLLEFKRR